MSKSAPLVGTFNIGPLPITVHDLSLEEFNRLSSRLWELTKASLGPLGIYSKHQARLDELVKQGRMAEHRIQVEKITEFMNQQDEGITADRVFEFYSKNPEGVVEILFYRTRRTHPDLDRDKLKAMVNATNSEDVYLAMVEALSPKKTDEATPTF